MVCRITPVRLKLIPHNSDLDKISLSSRVLGLLTTGVPKIHSISREELKEVHVFFAVILLTVRLAALLTTDASNRHLQQTIIAAMLTQMPRV